MTPMGSFVTVNSLVVRGLIIMHSNATDPNPYYKPNRNKEVPFKYPKRVYLQTCLQLHKNSLKL